MEILGDKQPYTVTYQITREKRTKNLDGTYTSWAAAGGMTPGYLLRLQRKLWTNLFGEVTFPENLETKVEEWNLSQKKDKHKILRGRDY